MLIDTPMSKEQLQIARNVYEDALISAEHNGVPAAVDVFLRKCANKLLAEVQRLREHEKRVGRAIMETVQDVNLKDTVKLIAVGIWASALFSLTKAEIKHAQDLAKQHGLNIPLAPPPTERK